MNELQILPPTAEMIGRANGQFLDWTGRRVGRLTVLGRSGRRHKNEYKWVCRCDCGELTAVWRGSLAAGKTKSCGCLLAQTACQRMRERARKVCACGAQITKRYYRNAGYCRACRIDMGRARSRAMPDPYVRFLLRSEFGELQFPVAAYRSKRLSVKIKRLLKEKHEAH